MPMRGDKGEVEDESSVAKEVPFKTPSERFQVEKTKEVQVVNTTSPIKSL